MSIQVEPILDVNILSRLFRLLVYSEHHFLCIFCVQRKHTTQKDFMRIYPKYPYSALNQRSKLAKLNDLPHNLRIIPVPLVDSVRQFGDGLPQAHDMVDCPILRL